ncbi:rhodanese-related sulfurtransferase [Candidatus Uhrbacteria bacterium]|jgi:UPF0176 protein|nr:rhodanese-related sulfurtransferase [Candidatus Uhrbacteria bacterium]
MKKLANKLNKKDALALVEAEDFSRTSISFYRYVRLDNVDSLRDKLWIEWTELGVLGRIYVSQEGINAQLNVPNHNLEAFRAHVDSIPEFTGVPFKIGVSEDGISFWKLAIKARKYILADGLPKDSYDVENVGEHLTASAFNEAIDGGAVVVDMRNAYESDIGHFDGAILPRAQTFKDELPEVLDTLQGKEDEKVLLYCTGGIRCEKTSAYLKHHGFKDVNQLHGGIIDYKHQIDREGLKSKYKGANFVFDGRKPEVITNDILGSCYTCKAPSNTTKDCANDACHELIVQCEDCGEKLDDCCSQRCLDIKNLPVEEQIKLRKKSIKEKV